MPLPTGVGWSVLNRREFGRKGRCVLGGVAHWFGADSIRLECEDPGEVGGEDTRGGDGVRLES